MNIRLEHVSKHFKNTVAVDDLSVVIEEGMLICLLGPSGCGKSTTLSMVAGLEPPTQGEIYFGDRPMAHIPVEDRDIGMVFQNYALYPHMTVLENIMFPLKMRRVPRAQRRQRAEEMGEMLQLTELLRRKPGQLSGGQQQRVSIGRALMNAPAVVLADEPTGNLDSENSRQIVELLKYSNRTYDQTMVVITHDEDIALQADRVIALADGRIVKDEVIR